MHVAALAFALLSLQDGPEHLAGWNASFAIPSGWHVVQRSARAVALSDSLESGILLVTAAFISTAGGAQEELRVLFQDLHYRPDSSAAPRDTTVAGGSGLVANYTGTGGHGPVAARALVAFTRFGTGVVILGMASPEHLERVTAAVQQAGASISAAAPETNATWIGALSGHWDLVPHAASQASFEEWFEFDGRSRFTWRSRIVVKLGDAAPIEAEQRADSGTYTVVGRSLILRGRDLARSLDMELEGATLRLSGRPFRRKAP
jgi:hypothetical protein